MIKIDALNGYVADNPKVEFKRCDGRIFSFDEINSASTSATTNNITITGGWSNFPLAYIDTDKTMEITFESSQITMDMFEMAAATDTVLPDEEVEVLDSDLFEVLGTKPETEGGTATDLHIDIPYKVVKDSVKIRKFDADKIAYTVGDPEEKKGEGDDKDTVIGYTTKITITGAAAIGDTVRVAFKRLLSDVAVVSEYTTSGSVKGELWLTWPVYSSGVDCNDAAIKGYLHRVFYRVRATASPSLDTSYKTAATTSMTFAAIDPRRADKKISEWIYEENA